MMKISALRWKIQKNLRVSRQYYNTFGVNGYQSETDCESGRVFTIRKGGRFIDTITGGLNLKIGYEIG